MSVVLVFCLAIIAIPAISWSKAPTARIKIEGDNLKSPIEILNPEVLSQFNVWGGEFIDRPRGAVAELPSGLQRLEVTLYVDVAQEPKTTRKYVFAYDVDPTQQRGFIFLPQWKNDLIWHGVEGNWLYASKRWNEVIMPIISQQTARSSGLANAGMLSCTVGMVSMLADRAIEIQLMDEHGNKMSRFRYETNHAAYSRVRDHFGGVTSKKKVASCWPART